MRGDAFEEGHNRPKDAAKYVTQPMSTLSDSTYVYWKITVSSLLTIVVLIKQLSTGFATIWFSHSLMLLLRSPPLE
jgi:hypothetical protein